MNLTQSVIQSIIVNFFGGCLLYVNKQNRLCIILTAELPTTAISYFEFPTFNLLFILYFDFLFVFNLSIFGCLRENSQLIIFCVMDCPVELHYTLYKIISTLKNLE